MTSTIGGLYQQTVAVWGESIAAYLLAGDPIITRWMRTPWETSGKDMSRIFSSSIILRGQKHHLKYTVTISHTHLGSVIKTQIGTWGSKSASSLQYNAVLILNLQTRTLKTADAHQSATSIQMSLTRMRRSRVILTLFVCRTLQEDADSVWGNGEGNPCGNFHGINADDLSILKVTNITRWFISHALHHVTNQ